MLRHADETARPDAGLTSEEVRAVLEAFTHRSGDAGEGTTTEADLAEALGIGTDDVRRLVHEVRAARGRDDLAQRLARLETDLEALRGRRVSPAEAAEPASPERIRAIALAGVLFVTAGIALFVGQASPGEIENVLAGSAAAVIPTLAALGGVFALRRHRRRR